MFDLTESLLPKGKNREPRVYIVGFSDDSIAEMKRLLDTLGALVEGTLLANVRKPNPATYIGQGKTEEIKKICETLQADEKFDLSAVVIDRELSPNQLRNLEKVLGIATIDRPGVILEIFSRHARSKESKTQVELAKLEYLLPRLAHFWTHFERQRGGIGLKGMGETQIEVDRRLVKKRMSLLKDRLKDIAKERSTKRSARRSVLKVALVGYTNAGKSTLLNAMTHSQVLAEDKLFATLDSSVRALDPDSHPPVVAIDTVGFISQLPHSLVASFRSTLEELEDADLLLHVVDGSSPQVSEQFEVTQKVLQELGLESKPCLVVMNKMDAVAMGGGRNRLKVIAPGALQVSALNRDDVERLRKHILNYFVKELEPFEVMVPYAESKMEALIHAHGSVEIKRHLEKGTFYRVRMEQGWANKLGLNRFRI